MGGEKVKDSNNANNKIINSSPLTPKQVNDMGITLIEIDENGRMKRIQGVCKAGDFHSRNTDEMD